LPVALTLSFLGADLLFPLRRGLPFLPFFADRVTGWSFLLSAPPPAGSKSVHSQVGATRVIRELTEHVPTPGPHRQSDDRFCSRPLPRDSMASGGLDCSPPSTETWVCCLGRVILIFLCCIVLRYRGRWPDGVPLDLTLRNFFAPSKPLPCFCVSAFFPPASQSH